MLSKKWAALFAVLLVAGLVLAACPAPASQPAAPQVVKETVVVEVQKEVQVVETVVVEVEKEVVATPTPEAQPKTLRVNLGTYPDIIDPQKSSFVNEIAHLQLMYEGLTRLDKDLNTVPGAAAEWKYNDDATQLTFTLQPDLKYSDGSILNAERYAYAIKRNINPETAGEYAAITDEIAGRPNGVASPRMRPRPRKRTPPPRMLLQPSWLRASRPPMPTAPPAKATRTRPAIR
jgi:ABC-type transport system substrate-binding protein